MVFARLFLSFAAARRIISTLSLESAVSVLGGWMILGQKLSPKELLGCLLMFIAVIGVQVFDAKKENKV